MLPDKLRRLAPSALLILPLLAAGLGGWGLPEQPADLILHNAFVWTLHDATPRAEAVAARDGRIISVGRDQDALRYRGAETRVIDLQGAFVLPGFSDNHTHFSSAARFLEFNIMAVNSQNEFVRRVREVVNRLPEGEWILGGYWGAYDQWAPGSTGQDRQPFAPDMRRVDEMTAGHPMFIQKFDNSEFAANRAAMEAVGLHPDQPRLEDAEFLTDASGHWNGRIRGSAAARFFNSKIPPPGYQRRVQQTRNALAEIRRYGVTNICDMSDDEQLEIFRDLHARGELTVRIHFRYPLDRWKELAEKGIEIGSGTSWIRLGSLKGHIDGIMGTSSARFFEPYSHQADNRGRWRRLMVDDQGNFAGNQFLEMMKQADRANLQLSIHAIGDEANHLLLNYLREVIQENGEKDRRFRLVHAQVMNEPDFERLGKLKVIAEVQPFHLSDDMRWMEERIGHQRSRGAYAFKSIMEGGGILSFGSDWPGTSASEYPINPMLGLYAAVTRQTVKGEPQNGWFPEQRIGIEEAIKAYTYNSSYANFEEALKGSLELGKLADITVLSQNLLDIPPAEILKTRVLYTIVDGKIVYQAPQESTK